MSMEMHVFFRGPLPSKAALTRAMKELGFPFTITPSSGSLEQQNGFMPMRLRREETGVEFDVFEGRVIVEELGGENIDPSFDRSANFRWDGDPTEMLAGLCAAAALAKLVKGIVLDEEEGQLLAPDEAIGLAKRHMEALAETPEPGTRPADVRRYLKPLLKLRSDLVLRGRHLFIRPVRNILRGALLGRTSDKYSFRIWRFFAPLYGSGGGTVGCGDYLFGLWDVREPHFAPHLLHVLAEDVFDPVGRITTLGELAAELALPQDLDDPAASSVVRALVLSGERARAEQYVRDALEREPERMNHWAKEQREFLARDIRQVCAALHAREAKAAEEYKLGEIWEPTPFPVELPASERASRPADPLFVPDPWVTRPPWLLQEVPQQAGEVRFAKKWIAVGGDRKRRIRRQVLLVALSREEAESRHRNDEPYVLAVRLPGGILAVLQRSEPGYSHWPGASSIRDVIEYTLELHGSAHSVDACFIQNSRTDKSCRLKSVAVSRSGGRTILSVYADIGAGETRSRVLRGREEIVSKWAMTDEERSLVQGSLPFGEFGWPVQCALGFLRDAGFDEFK